MYYVTVTRQMSKNRQKSDFRFLDKFVRFLDICCRFYGAKSKKSESAFFVTKNRHGDFMQIMPIFISYTCRFLYRTSIFFKNDNLILVDFYIAQIDFIK